MTATRMSPADPALGQSGLRPWWIVLALVGLSIGQPEAAAQTYHVHTYRDADGLPHSDVYGVSQAPDGRMWFATRRGIAAYDGQTWEVHDETNGLTARDQSLLAIDDRSRVWAVSAAPDPQLSVLENGQWTSLGSVASRHAHALLPVAGAEHRALIGHREGLTLATSDSTEAILTDEGVSPQTFSLVRTNTGLLAGTSTGLYHIMLGAEPRLEKVPEVPSEPIKGLAWNQKRRVLWVIGRDWVAKSSHDVWSGPLVNFEDEAARTDASVQTAIAPNGLLWFGTRAMVFVKSRNGEPRAITTRNGLISNGANGLLFDREGLLWISCRRGVSKIPSFRFTNFTRRDGLFDHEVSAILHRRDGTAVLGHNGGLTYMSRDRKRDTKLGPALSSRVLDLAEDNDRNLWVAAHLAGLIRIGSDGNASEFPLPPETGGCVSSVLVDEQDRLWVGTEGGVYRREGEELIREGLPEPNAVRKLFLDNEGRVLAATIHQGLWRLGPDGWQRRDGDRSKRHNQVYAYLDRPTGLPLIGTAGGLCTIKDQKLVAIEKPRIDRPVYFLTTDQRDRVWIGTDDGVMCWDGDQLRHYSVEHGLSGRETNRAAGAVDELGKLWVGTAAGLSIYRPRLDFERTNGPELTLTNAEVGPEVLDPATATTVAHNQNSLTVNYRVVSFADERAVRVRSWLEGLEPGWQEFSRPPEWELHYHFLPPGKYRLHLQAKDIYGRTSDIVSTATIHILAPFWQSGWFTALVVTGVAASGFFAHRVISQRRYTRKLESDVDARVAELAATEQRFRAIYEQEPECVKLLNREGNLLDMNPAGLTMIEADSLEQVRGCSVYDLIVPEHQDAFRAMHAAVFQGETRELEFEIQGLRGTRLKMETHAAPLTDADGAVFAQLAVTKDITRRRLTEEELRTRETQLQSMVEQLTVAEEAERRRLSRLLHDQLSPALAVCQMQLSALLTGTQEPEESTFEEILSRLEECSELSRSLAVEVSPPVLYELGLEPALEWLAERFQQRHGISTTVTVGDHPAALTENLFVPLFQATRELLINVVRHASATRVDICVEPTDDHVMVSVRDDGVGFNPADRSPTALKSQGFGLFGMRDRFHALGGHVDIESTPGIGTVVSLTVTFDRPPAQIADAPSTG